MSAARLPRKDGASRSYGLVGGLRVKKLPMSSVATCESCSKSGVYGVMIAGYELVTERITAARPARFCSKHAVGWVDLWETNSEREEQQ